MKQYDWERYSEKYYYYDTSTGKIVGSVSKIALQEVWIGLVYVGEYTFTVQDEKHLGQYINLESAKRAVQFFWEREARTLLCGPEP